MMWSCVYAYAIPRVDVQHFFVEYLFILQNEVK
jgi:hypothetical protein